MKNLLNEEQRTDFTLSVGYQGDFVFTHKNKTSQPEKIYFTPIAIHKIPTITYDRTRTIEILIDMGGHKGIFTLNLNNTSTLVFLTNMLEYDLEKGVLLEMTNPITKNGYTNLKVEGQPLNFIKIKQYQVCQACVTAATNLMVRWHDVYPKGSGNLDILNQSIVKTTPEDKIENAVHKAKREFKRPTRKKGGGSARKLNLIES